MYAAVVSDRYWDVNTSNASTNCLANPIASPAVFDTVKATTAGFGDSSFYRNVRRCGYEYPRLQVS